MVVLVNGGSARPPRSSPVRCRTTSAPWCWAPTPTARLGAGRHPLRGRHRTEAHHRLLPHAQRPTDPGKGVLPDVVVEGQSVRDAERARRARRRPRAETRGDRARACGEVQIAVRRRCCSEHGRNAQRTRAGRGSPAARSGPRWIASSSVRSNCCAAALRSRAASPRIAITAARNSFAPAAPAMTQRKRFRALRRPHPEPGARDPRSCRDRRRSRTMRSIHSGEEDD